MKPLRRLITLLLIGGIFNIAVAWRIAAVGEPGDVSAADMRAVESWPRVVPADWPPPAVIITGGERGLGVVSWRSAESPFCDVTLVSAGWPARALSWELWSDYGAPSGYSKDIIVGPATTWSRGITMEQSWRSLPIRPVWPGFVINTILFGGIAAAALYAPAAVRAFRRRGMTGSADPAATPEAASPDPNGPG